MEQAKALASILKEHPTLKSLCGNNGEETELNMSGKKIGAAGANMLAPEIAGNGPISKLNLSDNKLWALGLKHLAEAMAHNQTLTKLDLSSNSVTESNTAFTGDMSGVIALAKAMPDMGALSKLAMRQNNIHGAEAGKAFADMLAQNTVLKELDLSSQMDGNYGHALNAAFAKEFAAGISDNGAILSVNFLHNNIGPDQATALVSILKEHPTLKSLCGFYRGDETALDMRGKMNGAGADDAIMLAAEIAGNGPPNS
jgi:hypothetical protein